MKQMADKAFRNECPLTILEKKYMKKSSSKMKEDKMGVMYECDHDYEKQIEIVNVTCGAKILITFVHNNLSDSSSK